MSYVAKQISRVIDKLKREAKALGKRSGVPHHEALRVIAQKNGFPSWEALMNASSGVAAEESESCE